VSFLRAYPMPSEEPALETAPELVET
jgi:hypothetical protein